jgi:hypothetical protein
MFKHTLKDMRAHRFMHEAKGFIIESEKFMADLGRIDYIVVERYTSRPGKGGGSVSESINVMLGLLARYCHRKGIVIVPLMSAQWKNRFKKKFGKDTQAERYGFPVSKTKKTEPVLDHEADAIGIAHWFAEAGLAGMQSRSATTDLMPEFRKQFKKLWKQRVANPTNGKPRSPAKTVTTAKTTKTKATAKPASKKRSPRGSKTAKASKAAKPK